MGLKVALITPWKKRCGIYTYSRDLVNALAKEGVDVFVVPLPRFGTKTGELLTGVANSVPLNDVDLIHVQHEHGLYVALEEHFYGILKNSGKPVISTMHAVGNFQLDPIICKYSDLVIVHNEFCKSKLFHPSKIIPHGCKPVDALDKEEAKIQMGVDPRADLVGYVGFISEYKGLPTLIESMVNVPRVGLLIGGGWHTGQSTMYINQLKGLTNELLPDRSKWIGYVPENMLATVYSSLDLVVYPSIFATESGALLMAVSHGKAVIARRLSPFKEKEAVGALKTFGSIRSLTMNIKRFLKNDDERIALEEGAKKYAIKNSWLNIAKQHLETYNKVIQSFSDL